LAHQVAGVGAVGELHVLAQLVAVDLQFGQLADQLRQGHPSFETVEILAEVAECFRHDRASRQELGETGLQNPSLQNTPNETRSASYAGRRVATTSRSGVQGHANRVGRTSTSKPCASRSFWTSGRLKIR